MNTGRHKGEIKDQNPSMQLRYTVAVLDGNESWTMLDKQHGKCEFTGEQISQNRQEDIKKKKKEQKNKGGCHAKATKCALKDKQIK